MLPAMKGVGALDNLLSRPVSFSDYMQVFSDNYMLLLDLFGSSLEPVCIGDKRSYIRFTPLRKSEYTTAVRMSYRVLKDDGGVAVAPMDAIIYIYYDTWQAELVKPVGALQRQLRPYEILGRAVRRWLLNAFLRRVLRTISLRAADPGHGQEGDAEETLNRETI